MDSYKQLITKVMKMNTSKIDAVMTDLRVAFGEMGTELDVNVTTKCNIVHSSESFNVKINVTEKAADKSVLTKTEAPQEKPKLSVEDFNSVERQYYDYFLTSKLSTFNVRALRENAGTVIKYNGQDMLIIGLSSNRSNAGVVARGLTNTTMYKLPVNTVINLLANR